MRRTETHCQEGSGHSTSGQEPDTALQPLPLPSCTSKITRPPESPHQGRTRVRSMGLQETHRVNQALLLTRSPAPAQAHPHEPGSLFPTAWAPEVTQLAQQAFHHRLGDTDPVTKSGFVHKCIIPPIPIEQSCKDSLGRHGTQGPILPTHCGDTQSHPAAAAGRREPTPAASSHFLLTRK